MQLDFNNAAEPKKPSGPIKLKPGIHSPVFITEFKTVEEGTPYIEITFVAENGSGSHSERFYMSEKALPYTLAKLKELVEACGSQVPEVASTEVIAMLISGKSIALRLYGREIERNDGTGTIIVSQLSPSPFCASVANASSLKWDEARALKKIVVSVSNPAQDSSTDDLPF